MYTSFEYVYKNGGVDDASYYPYTGRVSPLAIDVQLGSPWLIAAIDNFPPGVFVCVCEGRGDGEDQRKPYHRAGERGRPASGSGRGRTDISGRRCQCQLLQSMNVIISLKSQETPHFWLQFYQKGIYNAPNCSRLKVNHAVLVVGYDNSTYQEHWIVKNRFVAEICACNHFCFFGVFQLGRVLGNGWVYLHDSEHVQSMWDSH